MILRLSDNSYLTNRGPWDDISLQWSRDPKTARKFWSEDEVEEFVNHDQQKEDELNSPGFNQLDDNDFLILTGFTTKKEE